MNGVLGAAAVLRAGRRKSMRPVETLAKELSARIRAGIDLDGDDLVVSFPEGEIRLAKDRSDERWVVWATLDSFLPDERSAATRAALELELRDTLEGAVVGIAAGSQEAVLGRNFAPRTMDAVAFVETLESFRAALPEARTRFGRVRKAYSERRSAQNLSGEELIRV